MCGGNTFAEAPYDDRANFSDLPNDLKIIFKHSRRIF